MREFPQLTDIYKQQYERVLKADANELKTLLIPSSRSQQTTNLLPPEQRNFP